MGKRITLLGATGRTGARVLALLMAAGHEVTTLGRRAPAGAAAPGAATSAGEGRHLVGDVMDRAMIDQALASSDALVNCLLSIGDPPLCSTIARHLAEAHPGLRYVTIAGAAVSMPGDAKGLPDKLIAGALKLLQPRMLADRQGEADILARSSLIWTMLRPPALTEGEPTGQWQIAWDRPAKFRITRGDLAEAVVAALWREDLYAKAPFVSGP